MVLETTDYRKVAAVWSTKFAPLLERWGFAIEQVPYVGAEYKGDNDFRSQSWDIYWDGKWLTFVQIYFKRYYISGGVVGVKVAQLREIEFREWGRLSQTIYCTRKIGEDFGKEKLPEAAENLFRSLVSWLVVGVVRQKLPHYLGATFYEHLSPNIWVFYSFRLYKNCWLWKMQWKRENEAQKIIVKENLDKNPIETFKGFERGLALALYL